MNHTHALETAAAERYLLDEMPELERYAFEEHYFSCDECASHVRAAATMRDGIREGLLGTASPSVRPLVGRAATVTPISSRRVWNPSVVLPWAAAAMLALSVGYQSFWLLPQLRDEVGARALVPVTLRAASRGADPVIVRPASGPVTLAVEVNAVAAGSALTYDLRTAGGQLAASGTAEAPSPGVPLLLLIPGSAVMSTGGYVLSIRAGDTGAPAAIDYRFTVTEQ